MSNVTMESFIENNPAAATLIEAMRVGWESYYAAHAALLSLAIKRVQGDAAQVIADTAAASVKHAAANNEITIDELHTRLVNILEPVISILRGVQEETTSKKEDYVQSE